MPQNSEAEYSRRVRNASTGSDSGSTAGSDSRSTSGYGTRSRTPSRGADGRPNGSRWSDSRRATSRHADSSRGGARPPRPRRGGPGPDRVRSHNVEESFELELEAALDAAGAVEPADIPTSFESTGLPERLAEALRRRGIERPFPIQARTLPDTLAGRDVLGRAQTGSGKTLAFGLPMLTRLVGADATRRPGTPRGLVLVPTRELAQQVADVLLPLARRIGVELTTVYGGASMRRQVLALRDGVDIVVATPGRLLDLIEQGECTLAQVDVSVLDEADYMADLGFLPAVTRLLDMTAEGGQRMLFSATLDRGVARLVARYLKDPAFHAVAPAAAPVESVEHRVFTLRPDDKVAVAAEIASRPGRTLFFVRTKHGADRLVKQLGHAGVEAAAIHGNLKQGARRRALSGFASGSPRVLIATDVAARGIHVDDVDLVVHFDPSADHKDYLHRSGRTARAGATGTVISLVQPDQRREVARLHKLAKVTPSAFEVTPGHEAVRDVAVSGTPIVVTRPQVSEARRQQGARRSDRGGASKRAFRPRRADGDRRPSFGEGRPGDGRGSDGRSGEGRPAEGRRGESRRNRDHRGEGRTSRAS
ncbi:DEAD/DEAH box helicase [Actinopolymorpha pittospori]|uniref:Superfamily II DNA/RNA helicase n=1 Tax=Actinopolymorpha pittospori TaxID=648752 RepID=A0A927N3H6_9ACTN|nr:DEAD/DEAH box helicase [Actinopolymorpha pittospori]MBE1611062.1 superfamily II DNA/RNA helicase [Actinopolymorpha pittospori]